MAGACDVWLVGSSGSWYGSCGGSWPGRRCVTIRKKIKKTEEKMKSKTGQKRFKREFDLPHWQVVLLLFRSENASSGWKVAEDAFSSDSEWSFGLLGWGFDYGIQHKPR